MELRPRDTSQFLIDELLRGFSKRGDLEKRVRPPLTTAALVKSFAPLGPAVPDIAWWFRMLDGQPKSAAPLFGKRGLRALTLTEAMRRRRDEEPQGERNAWVPLLSDAKGRTVCSTGEGDALAYLGDAGPVLPTLDALVLEELLALGFRSALPAPVATGRLAQELERLDTLMRVCAEQRRQTVAFMAGADEKALRRLARVAGVDALPADLSTWFAWHDGEAVDAADERTVDLHELYAARALGIDAVCAEYTRLCESDDDGWNQDWLPLFGFPAGSYWAYVLDGDEKGRIAYVPARRSNGAHVDYLDLLELAKECAELLERAVAKPELVVPADYRATEGQRRVLGVGAILTQINGERFDLLGGERRGVGAVPSLSVLRTFWDAIDAEDVCISAEELLQEHEATLREGGFARPVSDEVAFDIGRVHGLVGKAWVGMLLDAERAWGFCMRAARIAQIAYGSWEELGTAYATARMKSGLSREVAEDEERDEPAEPMGEHDRIERDRAVQTNERYRRGSGDAAAATGRLLAPGGAWHDLPFAGPLDDAPAVLRPSTVRRVTSTEELRRALVEALDGDVIRLAPGTYVHKLVVSSRALFFEAEAAGVIWEASGAESCIMERGGQFASFQGITFRAKGPWQDAPGTCVHIKDGALHFKDCVFEAAWSGVVVSGGAAAILEGCTVRAVTMGVLCRRGRLVMRGCAVLGGDAGGVVVMAGVGRLHDVRIVDTGGHGLCVEGSAVVAEGLHIERTGVSAVGVLARGRLELAGSRIAGSGESGIMTQPGAELDIRDTSISGVKRSGICAVEAVHVSVVRCTISDCAENAVLLSGFSTGAEITDCKLGDTGLTVIACVGKVGAHVSVRGCSIGASRTLDGLYSATCSVTVTDVTFAKSPRSGLFFEGGRADLQNIRIEGAVDSGVVANGGARVRIQDSRIVGTARGVHLEGEAMGRVFSTEVADSAIGMIARTGASLVAVDTRFTDIAERGVVSEDGGAAVLARCRFVGPSAFAVIAIEGSALLTRCEVDGATVGIAASDGDVEVRDCNVRNAVDAGVQAARAGRVVMVGTLLSGDDMNALFAHDGARVQATGCTLETAQGNGCNALRKADVTLVECTIRAKTPVVCDDASSVARSEKAPRTSVTLPEAITKRRSGYELSITIPSLPDDLPAHLFVDAALDLFEAASPESVLVWTRGEQLVASAASAESLAPLAALVRRLEKDAPAHRWVAMTAASASLSSAQRSLATLLRLLGSADPGPLPLAVPPVRGFSVVPRADGWDVPLAAAIASRAGDYHESLGARLHATGELLTEAFGAASTSTADALGWQVDGSSIGLCLRHDRDRDRLVATVSHR